MTEQEAYDGIRAYFSREGAELARTPDGDCVYRGDNDPTSPIRCAAGCLIPDDLYDPDWEGLCSKNISFDFGAAADFVLQAQTCHDAAFDVPDFLRRLDKVAREYGLTLRPSPMGGTTA